MMCQLHFFQTKEMCQQHFFQLCMHTTRGKTERWRRHWQTTSGWWMWIKIWANKSSRNFVALWVHLQLQSQEDTVTWLHTLDGQYMTKSAYTVHFQGTTTSIIVENTWKTKAPRREKKTIDQSSRSQEDYWPYHALSQRPYPWVFSPKQGAIFQKKKGRSKCNGNTLHSYICEEVGVDVSLTATWEHSDDHLALVLLSRSDLKTHLKGSLYEPPGSETGMREEESVS